MPSENRGNNVKLQQLEHPCSGKCTEFKTEPCGTCLVQHEEPQQLDDVEKHHQRALEAQGEIS